MADNAPSNEAKDSTQTDAAKSAGDSEPASSVGAAVDAANTTQAASAPSEAPPAGDAPSASSSANNTSSAVASASDSDPVDKTIASKAETQKPAAQGVGGGDNGGGDGGATQMTVEDLFGADSDDDADQDAAMNSAPPAASTNAEDITTEDLFGASSDDDDGDAAKQSTEEQAAGGAKEFSQADLFGDDSSDDDGGGVAPPVVQAPSSSTASQDKPAKTPLDTIEAKADASLFSAAKERPDGVTEPTGKVLHVVRAEIDNPGDVELLGVPDPKLRARLHSMASVSASTSAPLLSEQGKRLTLVRFPKVAGVDLEPFDRDTYQPAQALMSPKSPSALVNFCPPDAVMRWRLSTDEHGHPVRESNTRYVEWSDGSVQLLIGDSVALNVKERVVDPQCNFLFADTGLVNDNKKQDNHENTTSGITRTSSTASSGGVKRKASALSISTSTGADSAIAFPQSRAGQMLKCQGAFTHKLTLSLAGGIRSLAGKKLKLMAKSLQKKAPKIMRTMNVAQYKQERETKLKLEREMELQQRKKDRLREKRLAGSSSAGRARARAITMTSDFLEDGAMLEDYAEDDEMELPEQDFSRVDMDDSEREARLKRAKAGVAAQEEDEDADFVDMDDDMEEEEEEQTQTRSRKPQKRKTLGDDDDDD